MVSFVSFSHQLTPLHMAAWSDTVEAVKYLVDKVPEVSIKDDTGVSE